MVKKNRHTQQAKVAAVKAVDSWDKKVIDIIRRALVIKLSTANYMIKRVLIDKGNSMDIIFLYAQECNGMRRI